MSKMAVVQVEKEVLPAVDAAMELTGWRDFLTPRADITLKINLTFEFFLPGAVTSPWVVEGIIQAIQGYVGKIYIVESNQVLVTSEKALRQPRLDHLCHKYGVQWINMSRSQFIRKDLGGQVLKTIDLPEILTRTELVTVPVMKTHGRTVITGAVKNQWGCVPELRHQYHRVLDQVSAGMQ